MKLLPEFLVMETKPGYCHGSSGKLMNQYLVKDHMVSHYRKLYSAKAAVDCSVPKSMCTNVKYVDQKRREQMKKGTSSRSESQRSTRINSRSSCSSKNSRVSAQGEDSGCNFLDQSLGSSPRICTSFHSKHTVYPSQTQINHYRSASAISFQRPNPQWSPRNQKGYKTFQDPTQKTYSGDVIEKHTHRFTTEKPFTPRTLKSEHKPTLLQYRFYTPPRRKESHETRSSPMIRQETYHGSTQCKRASSSPMESSRPFAFDQEWSDVESDSFRLNNKTNLFRDGDFLLSSSREEELMYLEFITDVTNEILTQGLYSDRVLKRVFERHIDMNRHRLDEHKMRNLLDNLQDDLQSPPSVPITSLHTEHSHNLPLLLNESSEENVEDVLQKVFQGDGTQTGVISSSPSSQMFRNKPSDKWEVDDLLLKEFDEDTRQAEMASTGSSYSLLMVKNKPLEPERAHNHVLEESSRQIVNVSPSVSSTESTHSLLMLTEKTLQPEIVHDLHKKLNVDGGQLIAFPMISSTPINQSLLEMNPAEDIKNPIISAGDDNDVMEQVDALEKIMAEGLRVSESPLGQPEQTRGEISDEEF
ncbi:hypothetical protein DNTS_028199 [Danionella cerebrum]|uniref:Spermatogenesis-associated protein 7 n=1 Tax=Danionella cerebrum TaxID=2873325 RepID=A0A553QR86_9TELE|nr:hypothetical protein DNTS_028199 [Danionella translucida]